MLGLGNFCAPLLARNGVWELPIASAYFYSCLGFWLLFLGLGPGTRRLLWLGMSGTAFGLAVASRPHFVLGAMVLGVLWLWQRRGLLPAGGRVGLKAAIRETAALFLPLGSVIFGLLAYNYLRFEDPFQFGQKYVLAGVYQLNAKLMDWRYLPVNFYYDFLAPSQIERYFPFFQVIRGYPWTRPEGYSGAEDPYGVLVNMPFSWLALLAPIWWAWRFRAHRELGEWLWLFLLCSGAVAMATMCFSWATNRYLVDFIPSLLLAASLGLLMGGNWGGPAMANRLLLRAGVFVAVLFTAVFNIFVAFQHNGLFKIYRPQTYETLGHWFNQPAFWWEKLHPVSYGPAELTVRFPRDKLGKVEPLMVSGVSYMSDYLYVYYYPDARRIQLGFTHTNHNQLLSQSIVVDYYASHRIGIVSGLLYPVEGHPFFSGWTSTSIKTARHKLRVMVDGVPYLLAEQDYYESSPGYLMFGENRVSDYIGRNFTGEILGLQRQVLLKSVEEFKGGGFVRLGLIFPKSAASRREPLIATGGPGRTDLLFVSYESDERVRLGFQHEGAEPMLSPSIVIQPGDIQLLEASLGSFYPDPRNSRERELARLLVVRLNGQSIWTETMSFHPPAEQLPRLGRNPRTSEGYSDAFSGSIVAEQSTQLFPIAPDSPFILPPYWLEVGARPGYGAMRLHLELPLKGGAKTEPLLVTGVTAAKADYVSINSSQPGQLSFGFLHAGLSGSQSTRVPVDVTRPQIVEIDLSSFYPSEGDNFFATRTLPEIADFKKNHARVKLNGRVMIDTPIQAYESTIEQMTVGVDRLEQALGARFSGRILAIERMCLQEPSGLAENAGPLELAFVFPAAPAAGMEALLATGTGRTMDALQVAYDTEGKAHFVIKTAGGTSLASASVPIDSARHILRVEWGGLCLDEIRPKNITPEAWRRRQQTATVLLDGVKMLEGRADFLLATPQTLALGRETAEARAFSGRFQAVQRLPLNGPGH